MFSVKPLQLRQNGITLVPSNKGPSEGCKAYSEYQVNIIGSARIMPAAICPYEPSITKRQVELLNQIVCRYAVRAPATRETYTLTLCRSFFLQ